MPLVWNDSLATGLRQIDLQHQELIDWINALEAANTEGRRLQAINEVLPQLSNYALFHFGTEDAMFPRAAPEHAQIHRKQHQQFTERVNNLRSQPADTVDLDEVIQFLQHWLVEHIMRTDHELVRQIRPSPKR